jgi:hypothetical protein
MRRPRLRNPTPDPSVSSEVAEQEQALRIAILGALPDLRLPALRNLLRAVRYAEEGADAVVVRLSDLNDGHRRRLLLAIHGGQADGKARPAATEEAR